jgi:hypothetical protein
VPPFRSSITLALVVVLQAACSATSLGHFDGDGGHVVIATSLPAGAPLTLEAATISAVVSAAKEGPTAEVLLAPGPAGSAITVSFSAAAGGGNLWPSGRNKYAWADSQRDLLAAVRVDIKTAFTRVGSSVHEYVAADPVGLLDRVLRDLESAPASQPRRGVLNTTGVQTTGRLDMTSPSFWATDGEPQKAAEHFANTMPAIAGAVIQVVGIADFANVQANPDPRFAAAVVTFWRTLCDLLQVASCQILPFPSNTEAP